MITRVRQLGVDEPFHLVGLSLGAVTALRVLARSSSRTVSLFAARTWRPLQPRCTRAACRPDPVSIRESLALIGAAAPQAELRLAPGMHHIWNIEDVDLFNDVLLAWLRVEVDARLLRPDASS